MGRACCIHMKKRNAYRILVESQKERDRREDLYVSGRIILKYILQKRDGVVWTGLIWMRMRTSGGLL
jgi:hypothetical protein